MFLNVPRILHTFMIMNLELLLLPPELNSLNIIIVLFRDVLELQLSLRVKIRKYNCNLKIVWYLMVLYWNLGTLKVTLIVTPFFYYHVFG